LTFGARRASDRLLISMPDNCWASWTFGVTSKAKGKSHCLTASIASGFSNGWPLFDIITGSTTKFVTFWGFSILATTSTIAVEDNMPVFTAATSKSSNTASICAAMIEVGSSKTSVTSSVFWAVIAVITDMANTPFADIALISA